MPYDCVISLNLKHSIHEIRVWALVDQLQGGLHPGPLLLSIQTGFPERDDAWVDLHAGSEPHEISHVHRNHDLISS